MWKFAVFGSGTATAWLVDNPIKKERFRFVLLPVFLENWLGKISRQNVISSQTILDDSSSPHKCVVEICQTLTPFMKSDKDWNVHVIDSKQINAFVLPDGSIFVYTGLIEIIDSLDELGFVMAHELSHVELRHSAESISVSVLITIILMLFQVYITGDFDIRPLTNLLVKLPLSRNAETEADLNAVKIMREIGLDLQGGPKMMEKFKAKEGKMQLEILSTHPLSENRAADLEAEISLYQQPVVLSKPQKKLLKKLRTSLIQAKKDLKSGNFR